MKPTFGCALGEGFDACRCTGALAAGVGFEEATQELSTAGGGA